jgi:hypothetical protein
MFEQVPRINKKKLLILSIGGGLTFWITSILTSLLPIAEEYRAAYSNWSMQTVWILSLPMGIVFSLLISYLSLRYSKQIPFKGAILKSGFISLIVCTFAMLLIDVPQSFLGTNNSPDILHFFFVGVMFNLVRFLLAGITIGYLINKKYEKHISK